MISAQDLHKIANLLRGDVLKMVNKAGAGHVAGPLSSADLFAVLYFGGILDLKKDKIILSCGHYCPIQYAALARSGAFPMEELDTFMKIGSRLPGHPERGSVPGIEVSSGPLGQGASVAVGMALADRERLVYCVVSDGELQEGQVWEAFNFAVNKKLGNLIFILDRNGVQIEHRVDELVASDEVSRLEAFGLHVLCVDGNDVEQLRARFEMASNNGGLPVAIVMDTVAGKGVSFMENKPLWHDKVPTKDELLLALKELGVTDANNQ
jgi:transketolase